MDNLETMKRMYLIEKKSCSEIASELGIGKGAVNYRLKHSNVSMRTQDDALLNKYPKGRIGKDAANWRGGKVSNRGMKNYFYIHKPDHPNATKQGYVMEHRLVMEAKLGRYLKPGEIVHHINGNGKDNRPENLELVSRSEHVHNHFAKGKYVMELEERIRQLEWEVRALKVNVR